VNAKQAISKLGKLLGKNLGYRLDDGALVGEAREAAKERARELKAAQTLVQNAVEAKRAELLRDPDYVALCAGLKAAAEAHQKAQGKAYRRRIVVGTSGSMFFHVVAEGDNWDEVVEKVEAAKGAV
jgi:hypothetical protein